MFPVKDTMWAYVNNCEAVGLGFSQIVFAEEHKNSPNSFLRKT